MFIDSSYFTGPFVIAQLGQQSVIEDLNDFINRYEPNIMQAALGYDFYQAFLAGIEVGSDEEIEPRWNNLLNGVAFTDIYGIKKFFTGFAANQNGSNIVYSQRGDLFIYGGITPGFPVNGNLYSDTSLKTWNFEVEIFGAGTIEQGVDWNPTLNGGIQLTDPNYKVQYNERWVIHFTSRKNEIVPSGTVQKSALTGFIYYEYMKSLATQATGIGIVKSNSENSSMVSPVKKVVEAYNNSVRQIHILWELLQADQQAGSPVYPEFIPSQVIGYNYGVYYNWFYWNWYFGPELYSFRFVNTFGI